MDIIIRLDDDNTNPEDMIFVFLRLVPRQVEVGIDRLYVTRNNEELGYFNIYEIYENFLIFPPSIFFNGYHAHDPPIPVDINVSSTDWIYYDRYLLKRYRHAERYNGNLGIEYNLRENFFQSRIMRLGQE